MRDYALSRRLLASVFISLLSLVPPVVHFVSEIMMVYDSDSLLTIRIQCSSDHVSSRERRDFHPRLPMLRQHVNANSTVSYAPMIVMLVMAG